MVAQATALVNGVTQGIRQTRRGRRKMPYKHLMPPHSTPDRPIARPPSRPHLARHDVQPGQALQVCGAQLLGHTVGVGRRRARALAALAGPRAVRAAAAAAAVAAAEHAAEAAARATGAGAAAGAAAGLGLGGVVLVVRAVAVHCNRAYRRWRARAQVGRSEHPLSHVCSGDQSAQLLVHAKQELCLRFKREGTGQAVRAQYGTHGLRCRTPAMRPPPPAAHPPPPPCRRCWTAATPRTCTAGQTTTAEGLRRATHKHLGESALGPWTPPAPHAPRPRTRPAPPP